MNLQIELDGEKLRTAIAEIDEALARLVVAVAKERSK